MRTKGGWKERAGSKKKGAGGEGLGPEMIFGKGRVGVGSGDNKLFSLLSAQNFFLPLYIKS
jgi:hypothetical protein